MRELETLEAFEAHLREHKSLEGVALQSLDLRGHTEALLGCEAEGAVFLGCQLTADALLSLHGKGALIFPRLQGLPYEPYRRQSHQRRPTKVTMRRMGSCVPCRRPTCCADIWAL